MAAGTTVPAALPRRTTSTRSLPLDRSTASQLPTCKSCVVGKCPRLPKIEDSRSPGEEYHSNRGNGTTRIGLKKDASHPGSQPDAAAAVEIETSPAHRSRCSRQRRPSLGQSLG